jgi:hypothetical protein
MIALRASTVLLQWAVGGLLFLWVTTRRREVGLGYGWLLRGVYLAMAVGALAAGRAEHPAALRDVCAGPPPSPCRWPAAGREPPVSAATASGGRPGWPP